MEGERAWWNRIIVRMLLQTSTSASRQNIDPYHGFESVRFQLVSVAASTLITETCPNHVENSNNMLVAFQISFLVRGTALRENRH